MKVRIAVTLICISFMGAAQAQLNKCTSPSGKVTYSDVACPANAAVATIKNEGGNSLDSSGARQQVQKQEQRSRAAEASQSAPAYASQGSPAECKFSFYSLGDAKGKALAANAKAECLSNIEAKRAGAATSLEAYNFWRDHHKMMATKRSNAGKVLNCVPNGFGGQRCS